MSKNSGNVLVTGDIVLDCHLYGGVKTSAASFAEPGTVYSEQLGGAAFTFALLSAAADAECTAYDAVEAGWAKENEARLKRGKAPLPKPDELAMPRPNPLYGARLDIDTAGLEKMIPGHLHSYGVWTAQPARKGSRERVWRIQHDFGYGPGDDGDNGFRYTRSAAKQDGAPTLTLIDDGGILFRCSRSRQAWPKLGAEGWYLLKTSWPLCRGDLWPALRKVRDRLMVVVSAGDLRREDAQLNARLSWETCVDNALAALKDNPVARQLITAKHLVISFDSAGALWLERGASSDDIKATLAFDPQQLEGDHRRNIDGTAYGFQTCFTVGIAHHLMQAFSSGEAGPDEDALIDPAAMKRGITAGIIARRRLLELGHGPVGARKPGLPVNELGQTLAAMHPNIFSVDMEYRPAGCPRTILQRRETPDHDSSDALWGPAELLARYGSGALSDIPALTMGKLFTVDRSEIESLRTLDSLIREYERERVQKKPLSIGVFGPPGAGKSFGVKALAKSILGEKVPFLEFNLSQFSGPEELTGAFHIVRDAVLEGVTPVAFWDEFDSREYMWLQYLLAPMQDGIFQADQVTHPIGKCVFVFAGGTSATMDGFGVRKPGEQPGSRAGAAAVQQHKEEVERYDKFKLLKGPDFISRLHGFLNVLGPNRRTDMECPDTTWPIRRAIMLRSLLGLGADEELNIDAGLLNALLNVSQYRNGARSFEKIVRAFAADQAHGHLHRSALLPKLLLDRETDAEECHTLLNARDVFRSEDEIDSLARAVHGWYLEGARLSSLGPKVPWTVSPAVNKSYQTLSDDIKASNRGAAVRIPNHLALIGFEVRPRKEAEDDSWIGPLRSALDRHVDRLALAEHYGWRSERFSSGWIFGERDDELKRRPSLVPWPDLSVEDQEKDRQIVRSIPDVLKVAGYKAVRKDG